MTSVYYDELTAHAAAAARAGNRALARRYLEEALRRDEGNVAAWWWLAQTDDDRKQRHKILDKARSIACQNQQGLAVYRGLLEESGAPSLPVVRLADHSRSVGSMCPGCSELLKSGDLAVVCSRCSAAHHAECWEGLAYHCGNYGCDVSALINTQGSIAVEAAEGKSSIVIDEQEVPDHPIGPTRRELEAGFLTRLRQHAAATMMAGMWRQVMMEEMAQEARARAAEERAHRAQLEAERRRREVVERSTKAFLAGILPGILFAIGTYRYNQDWVFAIFVVYLTAVSIATAAVHALAEQSSRITVLYWLLPQVVAAAILFFSYEQWGSGLWSVVAAYLLGAVLVNGILQLRFLYDRRAFIVISLIVLALLFVGRRFLS